MPKIEPLISYKNNPSFQNVDLFLLCALFYGGDFMEDSVVLQEWCQALLLVDPEGILRSHHNSVVKFRNHFMREVTSEGLLMIMS